MSSAGKAEPPGQPVRAKARRPWVVLPALRRAAISVLPVSFKPRFGRPEEFGLAASFFPLLGVLFGAAQAGGAWVLRPFWPPTVVCLIVWAIGSAVNWVDCDGLADFCDAFAIPREREEILRIMKDPSSGAAGIVATVVVLAGQLVCMVFVPPARLYVTLMAAPLVARWASIVVLYRARPVSERSTMRLFTDNLKPSYFFTTTLLVFALTLVLLGPARGAITLAVGLLVALALRRISMARLGAIQGDVMRAVVPLVWFTSLLVASATTVRS